MKIKKIYRRPLFFIILIIGLFILYLLLTNYLETEKLYSYESEWFNLNLNAYSNNWSCLTFDQISLYYYNDPSKVPYTGGYKKTLNFLDLHLIVHEYCPFQNAWINISSKYIASPIGIIEANLTNVSFSGNSVFVNLSGGSESFLREIKLLLPIDKKFFNYYSFNLYHKLDINVFSFRYNPSIFGGHHANEESFIIMNAVPKEERPIQGGRYKWYQFGDGTNSFILRFDPKSKWWFVVQKSLDYIVLGIIAVLLYDLIKSINPNVWKELKKDLKNWTGMKKK